MDTRGYECECTYECGLIFDDKSYEEALHKFPNDTILHPDCTHVNEYPVIIEKTNGYIIVRA